MPPEVLREWCVDDDRLGVRGEVLLAALRENLGQPHPHPQPQPQPQRERHARRHL